MFTYELRRVIPPSQPERFETYRFSHEFYQEVHCRQEFERYCQWYQLTVERHHREMQHMRQDLNILSWFQRSGS
ncbi:MAG TPA: hypothetical protein V6D03_00320 [Candidatus Caenarcaniphilales bacterium]